MTAQRLGRFTPDEMGVLAAALTVADWPLPLQVRQAAPTEDAQRAAEQRAGRALTDGGLLRGGRVEPDLEDALLTLVRPRAWLEVVGTTGAGPADLVRVVAAHRGGAAVLAHQRPGPTETRGGDVVVASTTWGAVPGDLATLLLAALPAVGPGHEAPVSLRRHELRPEAGVTRSPTRGRVDRDRARLARLVAEAPVAAGQVGHGVRSPSGEVGHRVTLRWFDVAGDGRYLLDSRDGSDVRPCDHGSLARALAAQLGDEPVPGEDGARAG